MADFNEWLNKSEVEWLGVRLVKETKEPIFQHIDGRLMVTLELGASLAGSWMGVRIVFSEINPTEDVVLYNKNGYPEDLLEQSAQEVGEVFRTLSKVVK